MGSENLSWQQTLGLADAG